MEEQRNDDAQHDITQVNPRSGDEQAPPFSPNVGFQNPGSPGAEMGTTPLAPSSGLGAEDPASGEDVTGDEPGFDHGIVDETRASDIGSGPDRAGDD